jgi:hypothetical protein
LQWDVYRVVRGEDEMTDSKPVLFLYMAGVIDIFITAIVVYTGWGYEATEYYNWIQPSWLMFLYMITVNLVFCLGLMYFYDALSKNNSHVMVKLLLLTFNLFFYFAGFARLAIGAGSGIAIIASMVMV